MIPEKEGSQYETLPHLISHFYLDKIDDLHLEAIGQHPEGDKAASGLSESPVPPVPLTLGALSLPEGDQAASGLPESPVPLGP